VVLLGIIGEFKEFASKGSVIDLAVGVIIGAAFGKIVSSLVNDVIMPPIGLLLGNVNFSNLFIDLSGKGYATLAEAQAASAPLIKYGSFINTLIEFIIIAFVIFMMVKQINKIKKTPPPATPQVKEEVKLLTEIRDELKKK